MNEPKRWLLDPAASSPLKDLLGSIDPATNIPKAVFARVQIALNQAPSTDATSAGAHPDEPPTATVADGASAADAGAIPTAGGGVASAGGGVASAGAGVIASTGAMGMAAKLTVAVALCGVVAAGIVRWHRAEPRDELSGVAALVPVSAIQGSPGIVGGEAASEPPSAASEQAEPLAVEDPHEDRAAAARRTDTKRTRTPRPEAATPEQLQAEAALLESARRALALNPSSAMDMLREFDASFHAPALGFERDLLRIETHARLGHRDRALAEARALLRAHPNSVYGDRVTALIARLGGKSSDETAPSMKDDERSGNH